MHKNNFLLTVHIYINLYKNLYAEGTIFLGVPNVVLARQILL